MAVVLQPSGVGNLASPYYTALSSDQKPIPSGDRATLLELDTGNEYVYAGAEWYLFRRLGLTSPAANDETALQAQLLGLILSELRKIRRGVEAALGTEILDPGE